jgi:predicted ATPase
VREVAERSHASRFVGREPELQELVDAWHRVLTGSRCELATVVGDPGVGKSRLVAEALAQVDARVVRGRCLSYGEGITYWPVVEVVKQLGVLPGDEQAANAIRSLLGEGDAASGSDEIAWAFRKLLEEQAPLVVSFDDIQWAEETFLDLVESTAVLSTEAPLLLGRYRCRRSSRGGRPAGAGARGPPSGREPHRARARLPAAGAPRPLSRA